MSKLKFRSRPRKLEAAPVRTGSGRLGGAGLTIIPGGGGGGGDVPEFPSGYPNQILTWSGTPAPPAGWPIGWAGTPPGSVSVQNDATAPASPPQVARIMYPDNFQSGNEPQTWEFTGTSGAAGIAYTYWFKYSSGFQGEQSSVNKHLFLFDSSGGLVIGYTAARFSGQTSTGYIDWLFENGANGGTAFTWATDYAGGQKTQITLDQWHRVTVQVDEPTVKIWVDGNLKANVTNANIQGVGPIKVAPTWGGNTGDVMTTGPHYLFLDEIRVSRR